jgi:hypothetical protein
MLASYVEAHADEGSGDTESPRGRIGTSGVDD